MRIWRKLWSERRWYWRLPRLLVLFCLLSCGCAMLMENRLVYFPSKYPEGDWGLAQAAPTASRNYPRIEEVRFQAADGVRLHGWYAEPWREIDGRQQPQPSLATLLYLHGNGGNITDRYARLVRLANIPVAVFVFDYRGYGRSEGSPNEAGVYRDAHAAWDYLTRTRGLPPQRLVLYGESLGGAPACELATTAAPAGLVLVSTFTSLPDMKDLTYPFIPTFLMRHRMNNRERIACIGCPKLILHGDADEVIPFAMGQRLAAAARPPVTFVPLPGAGHNDIDYTAGEAHDRALREFLAAVVPAP